MPYYPKQQMITQSGVPRLARPLIAVLCLFLLYYLFQIAIPRIQQNWLSHNLKSTRCSFNNNTERVNRILLTTQTYSPWTMIFSRKWTSKLKVPRLRYVFTTETSTIFRREIQLPLYETSSQVSNIPKRSS